MKSIGFSHFVALSPNHLALVTPDGRHWSRAELMDEYRRLGRHPSQRLATAAGSSAEYLALLLVGQDNASKAIQNSATEQSYPTPARHPRLPLGINPDSDNTLYIGISLEQPGASVWALSALDRGCPLIITNEWKVEQFFRAVQQYQVTGCYLSSEQMAEITASSVTHSGQYELSSLRDLLVDGKTVPAPPNWPAPTTQAKIDYS